MVKSPSLTLEEVEAIVDEAHRLEDAATHGFSSTLSSSAAERFAADLTRFLKRVVPDQALPPALKKLRRFYRDLFDELAPDDDSERLFEFGPDAASEIALRSDLLKKAETVGKMEKRIRRLMTEPADA